MNKAFILNDYGSSEFSVQQLQYCIKTVFEYCFEITIVNGQNIINGCLIDEKIKDEFRVLCIGGGFDLGYLKSLGPEGIEQIKKFIRSGGNYLGICAGAYLACDFIEFDLNGPLQVFGDRPFKFFNGKAIGPINKKFKYSSEDGASATKIRLNTEDQIEFYTYLNGGCYFEPKKCFLDSYHSLAKYISSEEHNGKDAIVTCSTGFNGKCVLSGVHFEFDAYKLDLDNENIRLNVIDKLTKMNEPSNKELSKCIEYGNELHSNYFLVKFLFNFFF